jgi:hypothetical protein
MDAAILAVLPRIAETVLLVYLGYQLRASGIFKRSDGEVSDKFTPTSTFRPCRDGSVCLAA